MAPSSRLSSRLQISLHWPCGAIQNVPVNPTDSVDHVKCTYGLNGHRLRLGRKWLKNKHTMSDLNIELGTKLLCVPRWSKSESTDGDESNVTRLGPSQGESQSPSQPPSLSQHSRNLQRPQTTVVSTSTSTAATATAPQTRRRRVTASQVEKIVTRSNAESHQLESLEEEEEPKISRKRMRFKMSPALAANLSGGASASPHRNHTNHHTHHTTNAAAASAVDDEKEEEFRWDSVADSLSLEFEEAAMAMTGVVKKDELPTADDAYFSLIKKDFIKNRREDECFFPPEVIAICADMYMRSAAFRFSEDLDQNGRHTLPQRFVEDTARLLNEIEHFNLDDEKLKFVLRLVGFSRKMITILFRLRSLRRHWDSQQPHPDTVKKEQGLQEIAPQSHCDVAASGDVASIGDAAAGDKKQCKLQQQFGVAATFCACRPSAVVDATSAAVAAIMNEASEYSDSEKLTSPGPSRSSPRVKSCFESTSSEEVSSSSSANSAANCASAAADSHADFDLNYDDALVDLYMNMIMRDAK